MHSNPGKVMIIYNITGIVKMFFFKIVITIKNITSGFSVCGIWLVNTAIFTEQNFLPSYRASFE